MLSTLPQTGLKTQRVGRKLTDKPRPLKVILSSPTDVSTIVSNFTTGAYAQLDPAFLHVKLSRDRTPREIQHLKNLNTQLELGKSRGESDLTIKFVNNIPQIFKNTKKRLDTNGTPQNLNCYFLTVNGLKIKLSEVSLSVSTSVYDIIALVETNLSPEINTSELGLHGYDVYRCDRSSDTSLKSSVLLAIRSSIPNRLLTVPNCTAESVFITGVASSHKFIIGCVNIPPNLPASIYSDFCDSFDEIVTMAGFPEDITLLGDFNLAEVDWSSLNRTSMSGRSDHIINLTSTHNLKQLNTVRNYRGVILDLVFSSLLDSKVTAAEDVLLKEDRHHPALLLTIPLKKTVRHNNARYIHDFRRCNLNAIFTHLQQLSYPTLAPPVDIELLFDEFYHMLLSTIKIHTPVKKSTIHLPLDGLLKNLRA